MEKLDKGLTVPKWVLIVWQKIPAPEMFGPISLPKTISLEFSKKKLSLCVRSP